jgi:hypothetical protein
LYRGLRVSPGISAHVRAPARMTGYARNAGLTLAEKTSMSEGEKQRDGNGD